MKLQREYQTYKKTIQERLQEFKKERTEEELFYEVCFCLLAVQTKGKKADFVVKELQKMKYYQRQQDIIPLLKQHIRFHNNKAQWILEARKKSSDISQIVSSNKNAQDKREDLLNLVKGFGMKEASHYLRNTGHTGLAILDRHILNRMIEFGALQEIPPLSKKNYLALEKEFFRFANKVKINSDELDLLFWAMSTGEVLK